MDETRDWPAEQAAITASAAGREALIAASFAHVTGRQLVPVWADTAEAMFHQHAAIVAHGTEDDPVFFYGNRAALELFEMSAADFIRLPSRFSAEPVEREERARLMERVAREGFIDDYSGVRISSTGKRFLIERATVWNLRDESGGVHGQAAMFDHWTALGD
ncbi:MAG TPA: MEKHLA domain-containing protein [Sphingomonadaceae bacterium]|nr:MEKHLA domain-containing protein [Sphingomonadaceae bacterium]